MKKSVSISNINTFIKKKPTNEVSIFDVDESFICQQWIAGERKEELKEEIKEAIGYVLLTLEPRSQRAICLRYGFDGNEPHTYEEIGRMYGVTRERIRQILAKALRRLRHPARSGSLRVFGNRFKPMPHEEAAEKYKVQADGYYKKEFIKDI